MKEILRAGGAPSQRESPTMKRARCEVRVANSAVSRLVSISSPAVPPLVGPPQRVSLFGRVLPLFKDFRPIGAGFREIGAKFGLGQPAGVNKPSPERSHRRSIAAHLRRIEEIPARVQHGLRDRRQQSSRAQLVADQRHRAHEHAKALKSCLDREIEMLKDLLACRL